MFRPNRHLPVFVLLVLVFLSFLFFSEFRTLVTHHSLPFLPSLAPKPKENALGYCPSIWDISPLPPVIHERQTCETVPSKLGDFDTQICLDRKTCNTFTLRIQRTSPAACEFFESLPDPSFLPKVNDWMRHEHGPDAFYIRTDGAQREAFVLSEYEGSCKYRFDIQLRNPGRVWIQGWWTQGRYEGFSETNTSWPEMHLLPLFDPIYLDTCERDCAATQAFAEPLNRRVNTPFSSSVSPSTSHTKSSAPKDDLPACTGPDPTPGIWIPTHPLDVLYPPYPVPQPIEIPTMNRYSFHPLGCVWKHGGLRFSDWEHSAYSQGADWSPYAPSHPHVLSHKNESQRSVEGGQRGFSRCTQKHTKLFFFGDSHGRVLFDAVAHRLSQLSSLSIPPSNPVEPFIPSVLRESEKIGSKFASVSFPNGTTAIELEFLWDPRGLEFLFDNNRCDRIKNADVVIPSLGAHWANINQTTFEDEIPRILNSVTDCDSLSLPNRRHIMFSHPASPPRTDEWAIGFNDHRTDLRSAYQYQWVRNLTRPNDHPLLLDSDLIKLTGQWALVDFFGLTMPFTLETLSVDLAHYLVNDALEAAVDEVIEKAGICE